MKKLTLADIVKEIDKLDKSRIYEYHSGRGNIQITDITLPEGPIGFKRWGLTKTQASAERETIGLNKLGIVASVFSNRPNYPIHFDRLSVRVEMNDPL
jgi:hypothetical protein